MVAAATLYRIGSTLGFELSPLYCITQGLASQRVEEQQQQSITIKPKLGNK